MNDVDGVIDVFRAELTKLTGPMGAFNLAADPWTPERLHGLLDRVVPASGKVVVHEDACQAMARALDGAADRLNARVLAGRNSVWRGAAADASMHVLRLTRDLLYNATEAMEQARSHLDRYARAVHPLGRPLEAYRDEIARIERALHTFPDWFEHLLKTPGGSRDGAGFDELADRLARAVRGAIPLLERLADANQLLRVGLTDVTAKARAGVIHPAGDEDISASDAVRLAAAGTDVGTEVTMSMRGDDGILTTAQLRRVAERLDDLPPNERQRVLELFANAGSDTEGAYLMKAFAVGHPIDTIVTVARDIHGRAPQWLRDHMSLVHAGSGANPARPDWVEFQGSTITQLGPRCGPAALVIARAMNDPFYALSLTTDGQGGDVTNVEFERRFNSEVSRVDDVVRSWDGIGYHGGTLPNGRSIEMNSHADTFGTSFGWRYVDGRDPEALRTAWEDVAAATDAGYPAFVSVSGSGSAHVLLSVMHENDEFVFFDPWGRMVRIAGSDLREGDLSTAAARYQHFDYTHVSAVVVPGSDR